MNTCAAITVITALYNSYLVRGAALRCAILTLLNPAPCPIAAAMVAASKYDWPVFT